MSSILGVLTIIFMVLFGLIVGGSIILTIWAILTFIITSISNKTHGKKVLCTVKNVERIDRRNSEDTVLDTHLEAICEFEYNGKKRESMVKIFNEVNKDIIKEGSTINCIYNTKTDTLVPIMSLSKSKNTRDFWFKITIIVAIVMIIYELVFYEKHEEELIYEIIFWVMTLMFWYSTGLIFYDNEYDKNKDKYVKIMGNVVDYHVHTKVDDDGMSWDYYSPEISFEYNNEIERFISVNSSRKKPHDIGKKVEVYYNPESKRIYEKNTNTFIKIYFIMPIVIIVLFILKYLFKF